LLARQLKKQLPYGFDFIDVDSGAEALEMLKSGKAAAFSLEILFPRCFGVS
jgi:ABC-type amino acid transport substrate-binding protein